MRPHRLLPHGRSARAAAVLDYTRGTKLIIAIMATLAVSHLFTQLFTSLFLLRRHLYYFIILAIILPHLFTRTAIMILHIMVNVIIPGSRMTTL